MTILDRAMTDIQHKQGTRLLDNDTNNVYLVMSSIDLYWLYKEEKYKNKYLTMLKFQGTMTIEENKNDNTSKELDNNTANDSANGIH